MPPAERSEFSPFKESQLGPSPEPSASLRDALTRLEQAVFQIHDSESFRHFLDAQARFHRYAWANTLLILQQRPDATRVASFRTWLPLGRPVFKGERGISIFVPVWPRRPKDEHHDDDAEPQGQSRAQPPVRTDDRRPLAFKLGTVFDSLSKHCVEPASSPFILLSLTPR